MGCAACTSAVHAICAADDQCNFWTWHDNTTGSYFKKCFVRHDQVYDHKDEGGHVSGVCNHTLTPSGGGGFHGQSVGARMIDAVGNTTATKVRFRCLASMAADGTARLRSFSAHTMTPPPKQI